MVSIKSLIILATTALAEIHTIEVGENAQGEKALVFTPNNITTKEGDTLIFKLYPQHDITQGTFDKPCQPSDQGLWSGPFTNTDAGKKRFVVNVTSDDPLYFYCSVQDHCKEGMVGAINVPTGDQDITAYSKAAATITGDSARPAALSGGKLLDDTELASLTSTASSTASSTSSPPASSTTASSTAASTDATASPTGAAGKMGVNMGLAAAMGVVAWAL